MITKDEWLDGVPNSIRMVLFLNSLGAMFGAVALFLVYYHKLFEHL